MHEHEPHDDARALADRREDERQRKVFAYRLAAYMDRVDLYQRRWKERVDFMDAGE